MGLAMIRLLLSLCLLVLLNQGAAAQVVLSENFSGPLGANNLPPGWTSLIIPSSKGLSQWSVSAGTVSTHTTGNHKDDQAKLTSIAFATTIGQTYLVSFALNQASNLALTAFGGTGAEQTINVSTTGTKTFTFQASALTSQIVFTATGTRNGNQDYDLVLDNVVVTRQVPELDLHGCPRAALFCALLLLLAERRKSRSQPLRIL